MTPAGQRPLCPAGHLSQRPSRRLSPICNGARERGAPRLPISPQVGEMAGRPEGGA
ncbi:MAG: lytic murein transglycosylase, partial [Mesorhizobium sp.]